MTASAPLPPGTPGRDRPAGGWNGIGESSIAQLGRLRSAFLAGVAHDLRNPLSGLKTGIRLLATSEDPQAGTLVRLDRQVDRLTRMVDDLLDATRIEAGKLEMRIERVDLGQVVSDIAQLYAPTSPDHEIHLVTGEEAVVIDGDPLRVEQVVSNLVSNAIKFSPHGGRYPYACRRTPIGPCCVTDQGVGMTPSDVGELFMPFRRRRSDVAPGSGLGLSVVRRIVRAHGGEIEVDSEAGAGSTFTVRLPRIVPSGAAPVSAVAR